MQSPGRHDADTECVPRRTASDGATARARAETEQGYTGARRAREQKERTRKGGKREKPEARVLVCEFSEVVL